jgi:hypothetical protein
MELSIERLLRPSTPNSLLRLIPALQATALRYANKRSAANLAAQWLPPAAVAGAAAAAAADASVGGSGGEAAVLNTRLGKLLGSMRAWWPHSCGADSCRRVSGRMRCVWSCECTLCLLDHAMRNGLLCMEWLLRSQVQHIGGGSVTWHNWQRARFQGGWVSCWAACGRGGRTAAVLIAAGG